MEPTAPKTDPCPYCAFPHEGICSLVKSIEYFDHGGVRRVEFKTAADYPPQQFQPYTAPIPPTVAPPFPYPITTTVWPVDTHWFWNGNPTGALSSKTNGS